MLSTQKNHHAREHIHSEVGEAIKSLLQTVDRCILEQVSGAMNLEALKKGACAGVQCRLGVKGDVGGILIMVMPPFVTHITPSSPSMLNTKRFSISCRKGSSR